MHPSLRIRELLNRGETLVMPDAYDPISARIIQSRGFEALRREGVARVSLPTLAILSSVQALRTALSGVRSTRNFEHLVTGDGLCSWQDLAKIIGK